MAISDIKGTVARRVVLVAAIPLIPLVLATGFVVHLWRASVEFWEGFPEGIGPAIRAAWNGEDY